MRRVFRLPATPTRLQREVDDELAFHIETRVQRLIAAGMAPDAARREAQRQFGDMDEVRRSCITLDEQREQSMKRANFASEIRQDLVFTLRTLRRNAAFSVLVVGALAIGIGANTAIFSMIDAVFIRGLPVPHAEQLVVIGDPTRVNSHSSGTPRTDLLSAPLYRDLRDKNDVFSGVLASGRTDRLDVRIEGATGAGFEHPRGRFVSGNYFSVLGVPAMLGRTLDPSADSVSAGAAPVTISYGYWIRRFHGDRAVVKQTMTIDGVRFAITGVTPPTFTGEIVEQTPDLWVPLGMHDVMRPHDRALDDRATSWLLLLGRLKPGVSIERARTEISELMMRSLIDHSGPRTAAELRQIKPKILVSSGAKGFSRVRVTFEAPLMTLMIGVALLLCIICANVANMLLARAIARGREMSVRLALGANRARLVRQLLTEAAVLAVASAGAGLFVSRVSSRWILGLAIGGSTVPGAGGLSPMILTFTVGVSALAVAVFGLAPALHATNVDLASTMRSGASAVTSGSLGRGIRRRPLGSLLIAGQVALSMVLLVGAAILVRSLRNLESTDVGFDRDHIIIADVDIISSGYVGTAKLTTAVHTVRDRLAAIPGVAAVTFSENGIFSGTESGTTIQVPGFVARAREDTIVAYDNVGAGYVAAIGAHLLAGRDLETRDEDRPARTAVVNRSMADFYFPHESAVGKYIHYSDSIAVQIVGVVADVRDHALSGKVDRRMYFPYVHTDTSSNQLGTTGSLRFEVRTTGNPNALVEEVRKTVAAADPELPINVVSSIPNLIVDYIRQDILLTRLATAFGVLALGLAGIGLYGVMSYSVARRTSEIGLRAALGAQRGDVVRLVLADGLRLVLIGLVVGVPLAMALMRLLRSQLHGVGTADPASIVGAVVVLVASAVAAVLIPASRASRVAPIVALRES